MRTPHRTPSFTIATLVLAGLTILPACSSESETESGEKAPATTTAAATPAPQPTVLGPYTFPAGVRVGDPTYVKCWARLSTEPARDFPNPSDSIRGPVSVANLRNLDAASFTIRHPDWTGRVTQITAGPTARVTLFEQEDLAGDTFTLEPGNDADLAATGLAAIASLKIEFVEP